MQTAPSRASFRQWDLAKEPKVTLSNRNFAALFAAGLFACAGNGINTNLDTCIVTHFWELDPVQWRWVIMSLFISAVPTLLRTASPGARGQEDRRR